MWGFVGEADEADAPAVFTHRRFDFKVNGDQIVGVNLTSSAPTPLVPGGVLAFTYSVTWSDTKVPFERRFDAYLDAHSMVEHRIHWFAIANSFLMVLFLTGLVALILLRTLAREPHILFCFTVFQTF